MTSGHYIAVITVPDGYRCCIGDSVVEMAANASRLQDVRMYSTDAQPYFVTYAKCFKDEYKM
jgi:hypothetical protein